jgi:hypothetical protein
MTKVKYEWASHPGRKILRQTSAPVGRVPGVNLWDIEDLECLTRDREVAIREVLSLNATHGGNIHQRLTRYRKYTEIMISLLVTQTELIESLLMNQEHLLRGKASQSGRRWTQEQDEALIERACQPESSMMTLALTFNRTPGAIASRLTYLVGVSKVSRHVVGRITGYLDGVQVDGAFDGEIRPLASAG